MAGQWLRGCTEFWRLSTFESHFSALVAGDVTPLVTTRFAAPVVDKCYVSRYRDGNRKRAEIGAYEKVGHRGVEHKVP